MGLETTAWSIGLLHPLATGQREISRRQDDLPERADVVVRPVLMKEATMKFPNASAWIARSLLQPASVTLVAVALVVLTACGGGSGGSVGMTRPPTISNLQYSPANAVQGSGSVTVTGSFNFTSPGGNLSTLQLATSAGANQSFPLSGAAGQTSGMLSATFAVSIATVGHFTFEVWVVDGQGRQSNHLAGTFDVVINDLAASWTQQTTGAQAALNRVIWTGTQFVVVGYGGTILTSPDGSTWTSQNSGTSAILMGAAWSGARLVAVGYGSSPTVLTSVDGVNWSPVSPLPVNATTQLYAIAWSGTQFVAVGLDASAPTTAVVLRSTDGLTWTSTTMQSPAVQWVTWNGTQFVAVGGSGPASPVVLRSTDGQTWSADTIGIEVSGTLRDVASAGTVGSPTMVAAGDVLANSTIVQLTSVAGSAWQPVTAIGNGWAVGWSGSHFLVCGVVTCALSADGLKWVNAGGTLPFSVSVSSLVWGGPGNGRWVAIGSGNVIATSP
jgi:hypothetical protein